MLRLTTALTLLAFAPMALAQSEFGFDNRKPSGQEYLKPEESLKRMKIADGFEIHLAAAEPTLVNPIAFTIDEKGRLWVIECFEYPSRTPKGKAPRDRIIILESSKSDGVYDKRKVFAEGKDFPVTEERKKAGLGAFDMASGIEVGYGGVYVGAPPYLWFIENKDDKPGKFETLLSGFGSQDTHETLNTFQWGPDGWLYGLHGVFTQSNVKPLDGPVTRMNAAVWRFHPKTMKFEIFAEGTSNPWGMDWRNTDGQFILCCCVIPHLYHIVPGGIYKRQSGASYNPYAYGAINEICDHTFHKESGWAHAGLISLDAPHIPEKFRNSVIFGSIHGCSVKQNILKPKGSSFIASRGDDFLVSGDKNFRPINMKWGPNGDIFLIDWHDQNPCHQAKPDSWDYERGRVYRIQVKDRKAGKVEDLQKKEAGELLKLVGSDDPYLWRTALRLLAELPATEKMKVGKLLGNNEVNLPILRMASATVAVGQIIKEKVANPDPDSKEQLPKGSDILFRTLSESEFATQKTIDAMATTASYVKQIEIRRELASAAVRHAGKFDVSALTKALMKNQQDAHDHLIPHLVWIAYERVIANKSGGRKPTENKDDKKEQDLKDSRPPLGELEAELAFLAKEAPVNIFVRDHIVPKVMRRLVTTNKPEDISLCMKFLKDVQDTNTREKALEGLVLAFQGRTAKAPTEWAELQIELRKETKLAALVDRLGVSFRDPKALERAYIMYTSGKDITEKVQGLRDMVLLQHPKAAEVIEQNILIGKDTTLRAEAARQLGPVMNISLAEKLIQNWPKLPKELHADLTANLSSRKETAKQLLLAMQSRKIDRTAATDNTIIKMQAFNDKEINELIEKAWGRTRKTPDELNKLIEKARDSLYESTASFARGKAVFEAQCAKCHKFDGQGVEVGPQLDGAGRDIEYLLANIIDPNRVIGAPYFLRTVNMLDGQVIQGLLAEEDDNFITLKVENAKLMKLAKKDIDGKVKIQEKSMMPEGLTAGMTQQNFRDLLRYTMANPFITDVLVNDKAVSVGLPGRIILPDAKNVLLVAEFDSHSAFTTRLLVGSTSAYTVNLNGTEIGKGKGSKQVQPDAENMGVNIQKGKNKLTVTLNGGGAIYLRFHDPDRQLSYPEPK